MKRKFIKAFLLLLLVSTLVFAFVSCGNISQDGESQGNQENQGNEGNQENQENQENHRHSATAPLFRHYVA